MPETNHSKASGYRRFFANTWSVFASNNDVGVTFAYGNEHHPDGIVDEATAIMTPISAKILGLLLTSTIERMERDLGTTFEIPPEKIAQIKEGLSD